MPQLSPQDEILVHSQPQESRLFLSLYQPETVFSAQLRQGLSGTNGNTVIPYTNVATGTFSNILPNFAMIVGSTPGGNDLGSIRVRNNTATGTANALTVAWNNHVNWQSGCYLTVLNYVDVEAIYPRVTQLSSQVGQIDATFYKDYDIPYTNQNTVMGSFVCMGPHRAAFRDPSSGQVQLYWSSSGSYNVNGEAMSFAWEFEGGTPATSSLRDPGYVTYNQPGHYRTRLTISTSGTASDFGYRFVSIYDQPEAGPKRPIVEWEIQDLNGTRKAGGYNGRVKIWERVGPEFVRDGQLVVIFSDDFYGGVRKNIGGNAENCSGIFWVGYVMKNTIIYDYKESTVEFQLGSITEMMKQTQGFSVSCQDDNNPDVWFKILNPTIQRCLYHYLRWHTTAFNVADFVYTGDDRAKQYFDSNRESTYDAIEKFVKNGVKGDVVSDRQGKVWIEINPEGTPNPAAVFPYLESLGPNDIGSNPKTNSVAISSKAARVSNGPQITERIFPEIAYVEYGGIIYSHATGQSIAVLSGAPGKAPAYKGTIDHMEGMILNSQTQLNQIVGASYAYQNSQYPEIAFPLVASFKNIDIAPLSVVNLTIPTDLTNRFIP